MALYPQSMFTDSVGFSENASIVREDDGVVKITIFAFSSVDNLTIHFTTHDAGAVEGELSNLIQRNK